MIFKYAFPAALAALLIPGGAFAFDATSVGRGTSSSEAMPIHDGLIVVKTSTQYDSFDTTDADSPMAGATGPCWGTVVVDKGAASGGGVCHYTDADGDHVIMRWTAKGISDGRTQGDWEVIGGTGKWMQASGGGTFDAGTEGDAYTNNVTGDVTMN